MGSQGPMMTPTWLRVERILLAEDPRDDRGIGHRDDTLSPNTGGSVQMMDLQPALWEDDGMKDPPDLKDIMGV